MNKNIRRLSLLGCLLCLAVGGLSLGLGCSSAGAPFNTANVSKIVKGTTSKNDIRNYFGNPLRSEQSPNGEVWTYVYVESHTTAAGALGNTIGLEQSQTQQQKLVVVFNGDVVKDYGYENGAHTDSYLNNGR